MFIIPVYIGALSATIYQIVNYLVIGYLDPFFVIAACIQFLLSFISGSVVAFLILQVKRIKGGSQRIQE